MLYERVVVDRQVTAGGRVLRDTRPEALGEKMRKRGPCGRNRGRGGVPAVHSTRDTRARNRRAARRASFAQISVSSSQPADETGPARGPAQWSTPTVPGAPTINQVADQMRVIMRCSCSPTGAGAGRAFRGETHSVWSGRRHRRRMMRMAGFDHVIGFGMGGTSTDVALRRQYERLHDGFAGSAARADAGHPHGGRRRWVDSAFDGSRYRVGGLGRADPGPTCYRGGGPLCVTDANVMLIASSPPTSRPYSVLPATSRWTPGPCNVKARPGRRHRPRGPATGREQVAEGYLRIAVANMANAVDLRAKGRRVTRYALTTFGGARAGQHACAVADALGIRGADPAMAVLSAGIVADATAMREQSVEIPLGPPRHSVWPALRNPLGTAARAELIAGRGVPE